ncbi:uncharacterized protein [Physcomitrium patens]|uniref:Uncharacterized protein n=1 Tax=Physcomitrium patens TaxID=3218 RepID=A9RTU3_PHYPA|nr:uncharacterized protein LOC112290322 [Physcomitrium patens]XP_024392252.1 uncharacterized protein LOC112290322 [Physcomitrium patens]XP_024392261.1 uncharacterized protein LOC112290322 [Physcomitrium patens]XP_024392270.1 uncharacterized protein LOC112290322 [Physcomitrium patens]XP_024392279.1 uncharacterized protein LOC112290322 [Physcomitrium patens]XP_024392287.1 uncharacterized protein LOC112290322 [Physcomitrium patens]PNR63254.1 hypothetical protein PHYPA_001679 [Physcomitrium paten|eukprot:XP_024392247.1 uncharacterized protein LOC112290322 [Physcomitrella patens]
MDITRNIRSTQHISWAWSPVDVRPDIGEKRRTRSGLRVEGGEEELICPQPRRPTSVNIPGGEFMKPTRRHKSKSSARVESVACFELLDIFLNKGGYRDVPNFGCSPPNFCGSPPARAGNPLIHDSKFLQQRNSNLSQQLSSCGPSPYGTSTHGTASYDAKPVVRIEGFGSFSSDLSSQVSALA